MKKKYIAPSVVVAFYELDGMIAASPGKGADSKYGSGGDGGAITETDEIDDVGAKRFDAWTAWDE